VKQLSPGGTEQWRVAEIGPGLAGLASLTSSFPGPPSASNPPCHSSLSHPISLTGSLPHGLPRPHPDSYHQGSLAGEYCGSLPHHPPPPSAHGHLSGAYPESMVPCPADFSAPFPEPGFMPSYDPAPDDTYASLGYATGVPLDEGRPLVAPFPSGAAEGYTVGVPMEGEGAQGEGLEGAPVVRRASRRETGRGRGGTRRARVLGSGVPRSARRGGGKGGGGGGERGGGEEGRGGRGGRGGGE